MKNILFVGLGRMGANMAAHLSKANQYSVAVHNRSAGKVEEWLSANEGQAYSVEARYDLIILCVDRDEDVRGLIVGKHRLLDQVKDSGCIIDHTTTSAALAREMEQQCAQSGVAFLDAPVSGGEAGAVNGTLSCMIGGNAEALERARSILAHYCANVIHIGPAGNGQIAKMANQFAIAGLLAGLSEAINLIQKEGVDVSQVFAAISGGAAQSWQMDNRFETMVKSEFDFGFAVDHMIKDLGYALQHAEQQGWQPEIATQVSAWYKELSVAGHSTQDTSVLLKHYQ